MANMSYCRFRNTVTDLTDCINALEDVEDTGESLSEEEEQAKKQLIRSAIEIAENYGYMVGHCVSVKYI